jgi:YD repeat-containing protein
MSKQLLLFVLGMLPLGISFGQQMDQKMLPSGSGGMNQSMGNLASPNLFDGSANVNIPIHEFGAFGISLSYNTKGVPVEELSGQIGTHWVLNAGGSITRNVKDIPDEANREYDDPVNANNIKYSILGRAHVYNAQGSQPLRQYWDGENDEFNVSAGSLQFTFKVGKNGYIFTYPENRYKITPIANSYNPNGINMYDKFEITDEQGTKYTFGTKAEEMSGNIVFGNTGISGGLGLAADFYYTPKWFLDKVEFTNGQAIHYTYEYMDYPEFGSGTEGLRLYRTRSRNYLSNGSDDWDPEQDPVYMADLQESTYNLTSIQYPDNTTVNFIFDQGAGYQPACMKSIKQIEISQGENCIKYRINKAYLKQGANYSHFAEEEPFDNGCNYNPVQMGNKRMILKGIDILSCDESNIQPYYSFEYSNVAPPSRLGNNRDFFGYCNGILNDGVSGDNLYPTNCKSPFDASNGPTGDCNRCTATDVNIMTALCLTKVKNAYGGSLSFQYELHSGLVSVTDGLTGMPDPDLNYTNHLFLGKNAADGLRLKRTIAEDKYRPGSKLITTYTYAGGQFFLNGGYYAYPSVKDINGNITRYKATTNWVSAHQLINGSNHGYSQVTVTSTDISGNMLSKTIHYFSNFKEGNTLNYKAINPQLTEKHYFQAPYTDKQYIMDWKVGLPLKTETYDKGGNITSRTTNLYDTETDQDFITAETWLGVNTHRMRISVTGASGTPYNNTNYGIMDPVYNFAIDNYVPFRGKALLVSTTSEKFLSNSYATTDVVEFFYDGKRNLIRTRTRNSKNEYFLTKNIYNYQVSGAATLTALTNAGFEKVVSTERWKEGNMSQGDQLLDANITTFTYNSGILSTQKVQSLQSLAPVSYNDYTNSGAAVYNRILTAYNNPAQPLSNFRVASEVLQYDDKHNPVETQLGGQGSYLSMIWDPATGNKLAEANCKKNEMAFSGFESENKGNWTYDAGFVEDAANMNIERIDGRKVLRVVNVQSAPLSIAGLTPNKEYTFTFWYKGPSMPVLAGGGLSAIPYTELYAANGWKYYQARFTPVNGNAVGFGAISNGGGSPFSYYLDDVRIFPTGATMSCMNYEPLRGLSSSVDPSGRITYYEYDAFGRVKLTRDQEGRILAKKDYHIAQ